MQNTPEFTTTITTASSGVSASTSTAAINKNNDDDINNNNNSNMIVPDIKSANILMNSYAKLADIVSAKDILNQMKKGGGKDGRPCGMCNNLPGHLPHT